MRYALLLLLSCCGDGYPDSAGIVAEVLERGSRGALLEDGPLYRVRLEDDRRVTVIDIVAAGDCVGKWGGGDSRWEAERMCICRRDCR